MGVLFNNSKACFRIVEINREKINIFRIFGFGGLEKNGLK
jgi:hypothetical protein